MRRNNQSDLKRRARDNPMATHDRLHRAARLWSAQAVLPWSAASVARIWAKALRETGSEEEALARLSRAEVMTLSREKNRDIGTHSRKPIKVRDA